MGIMTTRKKPTLERTPAPGEHTIRSRAFDVDGNVQPAPDDPFLASKENLLGK